MIGTALQVSDPNDFNGGRAISEKNPLPVRFVDATGTTAPSSGPLMVSDFQNAAYSSWPTLTPVSGVYTMPPGARNLSVNATDTGTISLFDAEGNVKTIPLMVGFQTLPFLPVSFTTTATATFWADT